MILLEIERKVGAEFGAGIGTFWDGETGEVLASGPMVTGPRNKLDPKEYGSITPPGEWFPVEPLGKRPYPDVGPSTFSRLMPLDGQQVTHPKRTYGIHRTDPFMSHYAGSSTGCPSCLPSWWGDYKKVFNESFEKGLVLSITDSDDVDLSPYEKEFENYSEEMRERGR